MSENSEKCPSEIAKAKGDVINIVLRKKEKENDYLKICQWQIVDNLTAHVQRVMLWQVVYTVKNF